MTPIYLPISSTPISISLLHSTCPSPAHLSPSICLPISSTPYLPAHLQHTYLPISPSTCPPPAHSIYLPISSTPISISLSTCSSPAHLSQFPSPYLPVSRNPMDLAGAHPASPSWGCVAVSWPSSCVGEGGVISTTGSGGSGRMPSFSSTMDTGVLVLEADSDTWLNSDGDCR